MTHCEAKTEKSLQDWCREVAISGFTSVEQACKERGLVMAGADEAGRGPLAGPVVAAAVILPVGTVIEGVYDSKTLSEKKREELYEVIIKHAVAYSTVVVDADRIEEINILNATKLAFTTAVSTLAARPDVLFHDEVSGGLALDIPSRSVIKGDQKIYSIAAASILAKVTRDRIMRKLDKEYPEYGFVQHKGYGTQAHREAILRFGPCPEHRPLYLRKILGEKK